MAAVAAAGLEDLVAAGKDEMLRESGQPADISKLLLLVVDFRY